MSDARAPVWPPKRRDVLNHHQDSTNWDLIAPREGDIVAANWAKAGITWLQQIIVQLVTDGSEDASLLERVIWPDWWSIPKDSIGSYVEAAPSPRIFKTHLPADALTLSPLPRYLYIGRDPRDVAFSLYPHLRNYSQGLIDAVNSAPHRDWAEDWGPPTSDIRQFYLDWLARDGWPYWPFWAHVRSWWQVRRLPNVLLVHHATLKRDLEGQARRIAAFLGIRPDRAAWARILEHCSFGWMSAHTDTLVSADAFKAPSAFMNRGVNGRWLQVLSAEEIALCDQIALEELGSECAGWLATGELG
jgi:aryl sulfotransferase